MYKRQVHFNDVYNLEPTGGHDGEPIGGAASFAAKLKEMRANDPNILTVFGGDLLGPSMMSGVTKGRHMVNVLNNLGIDYGCFGNHEFDFGMKGLNKTLYTPGVSSRTTFACCMITFNPPMKASISSRLQKASSKLTSVAATNFLRDATSCIGVFGPWTEEAAPMFYFAMSAV